MDRWRTKCKLLLALESSSSSLWLCMSCILCCTEWVSITSTQPDTRSWSNSCSTHHPPPPGCSGRSRLGLQAAPWSPAPPSHNICRFHLSNCHSSGNDGTTIPKNSEVTSQGERRSNGNRMRARHALLYPRPAYVAVSASVIIWVPKSGESKSGQMVPEKVIWS